MFLIAAIGIAVLGLALLSALAVAVLVMKAEDKRMRLHHTPTTARERYARWVMGLYVRDEDDGASYPDPQIRNRTGGR
jgi:hypothetical protein